MDALPKISLQHVFEDKDDWRPVGRCRSGLKGVRIAICGVLGRAESGAEIEECGNSKRLW